jgi:hypothetical protein
VTNFLTRFAESIGASWRGYERLWIVFWIYYVPVAIVLLVAPGISSNEWYLWVPVTVITLVWLVWIMVSLWRCAYATDYRILGHLVRLNVFVGLAIFLFDVALVLVSALARQS